MNFLFEPLFTKIAQNWCSNFDICFQLCIHIYVQVFPLIHIYSTISPFLNMANMMNFEGHLDGFEI
jgi:hypothetical protein